MRARRRARPLVALALALAVTACAGTDPAAAPPSPAAEAATTTATTTAAPITAPPTTRPTAPNGRLLLTPPRTPADVAAELTATDAALRTADAAHAAAFADIGHRHQLAYRTLAARPEWDTAALAALAEPLRSTVTEGLRARRAFFSLTSGFSNKVPAWQIVEPAPADQLLAWYREAERATGIGWSYLAAINFVETGFGRIRGLSSAGAQGPMQFLPSTWNEAGIGRGDINDPRDAIAAAARYLVRRGGPADMRRALFGYNNHDGYVDGVTRYAALMAADERTFVALYNWEIYFSTERGSLWFPVGVYREPVAITVDDYLRKAPWSLVG